MTLGLELGDILIASGLGNEVDLQSAESGLCCITIGTGRGGAVYANLQLSYLSSLLSAAMRSSRSVERSPSIRCTRTSMR